MAIVITAMNLTKLVMDHLKLIVNHVQMVITYLQQENATNAIHHARLVMIAMNGNVFPAMMVITSVIEVLTTDIVNNGLKVIIAQHAKWLTVRLNAHNA